MSIYKEYEDKMSKTVDALSDELNTLRAGRANPAILNKLVIDYYGVATPITQVGNVTVPEARTLIFQPWDASVLPEVEKEIQKSDIGINPQNDGKVLRLTFPQLTEERRKEIVKSVKKYGEDSKVSIRGVRRDANDQFKKMLKESAMTEDDLKDAEKDLQKIIDKKIEEINKLVADKEKELLEL